MLLARELLRVLAGTLRVGMRRPLLLLTIAVVATVAVIATTVTLAGPVALYPFL